MKNKSLCHILPPKAIYAVLQEAEAKGVVLPMSIDKWWERETLIEVNQEEHDKTTN